MLERKWPEKYNARRPPAPGPGACTATDPRRFSRGRGAASTTASGAARRSSPCTSRQSGLLARCLICRSGTCCIARPGRRFTARARCGRRCCSPCPSSLSQSARSWSRRGRAPGGRGSPTHLDPPCPASAYALTTVLHLLQPLARLHGRLSRGLTPWRRARAADSRCRGPGRGLWTPNWEEPERRLRSIESALLRKASRRRGGDYDRWDLQIPGGSFGVVRLLMAVEDHGAGTQYVRFRSWPRCSRGVATLALLFASLAALAGVDGAWAAPRRSPPPPVSLSCGPWWTAAWLPPSPSRPSNRSGRDKARDKPVDARKHRPARVQRREVPRRGDRLDARPDFRRLRADHLGQRVDGHDRGDLP